MTVIAFSQAIGPVALTCIVREKHSTGLEITQIPIETGSQITDHAVVMPKTVSLEVGSDNAAATYEALIRFQESRIPFIMVTGLKVYRNMLIQRIEAERDATYSKVLKARVDLQEVILVDTAYAADPNGEGNSGGGRSSGKPGGAKSTRAATPSQSRAGDKATADRSGGTVKTGDNPTTTYKDQSILKSMFGG